MTLKEKVEKVVNIPIPLYMKEEVIPLLGSYYGPGEGSFEYKPFEKCPLHNEDTASFKYYEATNSCYCFGCRRGGDIINLHRLVYEANENIEISYQDAVNHLYAKFIEGRDDVVAASKQKKKKITFVDGKAVVEDLSKSDEVQTIDRLRHNKKLKEAEERIRITGGDKMYDKFLLLDFIEKLTKVKDISIEESNDYLDKL